MMKTHTSMTSGALQHTSARSTFGAASWVSDKNLCLHKSACSRLDLTFQWHSVRKEDFNVVKAKHSTQNPADRSALRLTPCDVHESFGERVCFFHC